MLGFPIVIIGSHSIKKKKNWFLGDAFIGGRNLGMDLINFHTGALVMCSLEAATWLGPAHFHTGALVMCSLVAATWLGPAHFHTCALVMLSLVAATWAWTYTLPYWCFGDAFIVGSNLACPYSLPYWCFGDHINAFIGGSNLGMDLLTSILVLW